MSGDRPHEWRFYLDDMIEFAENVIDYTKGSNRLILRLTKLKPQAWANERFRESSRPGLS